jgi:hypothetical protein
MIMNDALPGIKSFFKATTLKPKAVGMLIRFVAAFTGHLGRILELMRDRARQIAADPEGLRQRDEYRASTRPPGDA